MDYKERADDLAKKLTACAQKRFEQKELARQLQMQLEQLKGDKARLVQERNQAEAERKILAEQLKEAKDKIEQYIDTLKAYQFELAKCQAVG